MLPVDVNRSRWNNTLEPGADGAMALRLGFRQVKGLREEAMERLVAARGNGYPDPWTLWRRAGLPAAALERLARADAFGSLGLNRRRALWAVRRFRPTALPLFAAMDEDEQSGDPPAALPSMTLGEQVVDDYVSVRLTLRAHPLALLRAEAPFDRATPHSELLNCRNGQQVEVAGLVLIRQRPGTAKGVVFMTLEDETGAANVIVWPHALERYRPIVMGARLVRVAGEVQKEGHRHPHRRAPAGGPVRPARRPGPTRCGVRADIRNPAFPGRRGRPRGPRSPGLTGRCEARPAPRPPAQADVPLAGFPLSHSTPLPSVISTERSEWRNLSRAVLWPML